MTVTQNNPLRIHRRSVPGRWLTGSELYVCAVQPLVPEMSTFAHDGTRTDALKLAEAILASDSNEKPRITQWSQSRPAVVLFPELAFSTEDVSSLDSWVTGLPSSAIVLAGFGYCTGDRLQKILKENPKFEPGWPDGFSTDRDGTYNAGWCWLHCAGEEDVRIVFLKNFAEQRVEVAAIDDWTPGTHILRLDTEDLTLFPLICADLIAKTGQSPRARIRRSLEEDPPRAHVLVVGLLHTEKTYSDFWKEALNDLTSLDGHARLGIFLVNQARPQPCEEEAKDAWRSLTGGFISRGEMHGPPSPSLAHVRFVETDQARGLLLRLTEEPGVAAGMYRWHCVPGKGHNVWIPNRRFLWRKSNLVKERSKVPARELSRFLVRKRNRLIADVHENLAPTLEGRIADIRRQIDHENAAEWIANLWPRLIRGLHTSESCFDDADQLHEYEEHLARALLILASLCDESLARLFDKPMHDAQLFLDSNRHVMIWNDPELRPERQIRQLEGLVADSGPPLFVLGAGRGGVNPMRQRVNLTPRIDITRPFRASATRREVGELRNVRPVWWLALGAFEDALGEKSWASCPEEDISSHLNDRIREMILGTEA